MSTIVKPQPLAGLAVREFSMLIDGKWVQSQSGGSIERVAPGHGVTVSRYPTGNKADVERAVAAARKAFDDGRWSSKTASQRSLVLLKAA